MTPSDQLLVVLSLALLAILSQRAAPDLVAVFLVVSLSLLGVITPEQALSGFSRPAVVALAGLFVITRALDSNGVVHWLGQRLEAMAGASEARLVAVFMLAGAALSIVMNNIAAGSVLLPAALGACRRARVAPSRLLIPLGYGILLGGMATLFTTANLVLSSCLEGQGQKGLTMLDFLAWGGALCLLGIAFTVLWGRKFLPRLGSRTPVAVSEPDSEDLLETYGVHRSLFEGRIRPESILVGQTIAEANIGNRLGVSLLGLLRGQSAHLDLDPRQQFQEGDVLLLLGRLEDVQKLKLEGLALGRRDSTSDLPVQVSEAIVAPRSSALGHDLIRLRMRQRYGVTVVGLWRRGQAILSNISRYKLQEGDALLVLGSEERIESLAGSPDFVLPHHTPRHHPSQFRVALTLLVAAVSMTLAAQGLVPLAMAMLGGGALLVLSGCLTAEDAYRGIEWKILVLIACMSPVGAALTSTGLSHTLSQSLLGFVSYGPQVFTFVCFLAAALLSQVIGGQVASLVLGPVVVASVAHLDGHGISAHQIAIVLALGCSTAFLTPVAHPVNLLMMGACNYRQRDLLRLGIPLTLLCALWVALRLWLTR